MVASVSSRSEIARLLSASTAESAVLWTGLPNTLTVTKLSDPALTVAVELRLGLPVATQGGCRCGRELDALGDHALCCNKGIGRGAWHFEVNTRISSFLSKAGCPSVREPTGLARSDGKRPDGVTVLPFERGLPLAWDATVRHKRPIILAPHGGFRRRDRRISRSCQRQEIRVPRREGPLRANWLRDTAPSYPRPRGYSTTSRSRFARGQAAETLVQLTTVESRPRYKWGTLPASSTHTRTCPTTHSSQLSHSPLRCSVAFREGNKTVINIIPSLLSL